MAPGAGKLMHDIAVPIEAEPLQAVNDRGDRRVRRALAIGILDAQEHLAAGLLRIKPVEQSRARAADMQEARRRRGKTRHDGRGHRAKPTKARRATRLVRGASCSINARAEALR